MNNKLTKKILGLTIIGSGLVSAFAMSDMMSDHMMSGSMKMEIMTNMSVGSKGDEVVSLQTFLMEKGFLNIPSGVAKGYFGAKTKIALKKYQKENGINATGYFGAMTRAKFNMSMGMMDNNSSMGVMVGGAMMLPSRDIVDNAVLASNVTTVVAAVKAAGLVDTLKSAGPFTVFAPDNAAFAKLPAGTVEKLLKPENKTTLSKILTYHVVAGRYTSVDLKDGMMLKTVQGQELKVTIKNGSIFINNALVLTKDVISSNGVTFVIDSVLMPK